MKKLVFISVLKNGDLAPLFSIFQEKEIEQLEVWKADISSKMEMLVRENSMMRSVLCSSVCYLSVFRSCTFQCYLVFCITRDLS